MIEVTRIIITLENKAVTSIPVSYTAATHEEAIAEAKRIAIENNYKGYETFLVYTER